MDTKTLREVKDGRAIEVEFPSGCTLEVAEAIIRAIHSCVVRFPNDLRLTVTPEPREGDEWGGE